MSQKGNHEEIIIRPATIADAESILKIYGPYVEKTAVTFEYAVPSIEEFRDRIRTIQRKYPYLVAEKMGQILGYTYASVFKDRAAYDYCVETTIYLEHNCRRMGLGRKLYDALEKALKKQNIHNLYACIGYPLSEDEYLTLDSVKFHKQLGYHLVGQFHHCGYKFDRWYDMVWMEKLL